MDRPAVFEFGAFEEALEASRSSGRPLIIDFTAEWCAPCRAMDRTAWRDERVLAWMRDHAHAAQIDIDRDESTADRYGVKAVPTVIALRGGQEVDRFTGARSADKLLEWLDGLSRGESEIDRLKASARGAGVQARHELARGLMSARRHEEALAEYLWLWNHSLEAEPGWIGVRYSYLLMELTELVGLSEAARQEFARLRAEAEGEVQAGDLSDSVLADWFALNQVLGEEDRSLSWFDRIKDAPPPGLEVSRLERWLGALLKGRQRWADLARLYPNPLAVLDRQAQLTREMVEGLEGDPQAMSMPEMLEGMREFARTSLRELASDLIRALDAAGRREEGEQVVSRARELDSSPEMAEALSAARTPS
jgi:thiol-disulfide isomerase/thioredoxin